MAPQRFTIMRGAEEPKLWRTEIAFQPYVAPIRATMMECVNQERKETTSVPVTGRTL